METFKYNYNIVKLGKKSYFVKEGGRVHALIDIKAGSVMDRFHFYRSTGTNAKMMFGIEYTEAEIYGKWFMCCGISDKWINKISSRRAAPEPILRMHNHLITLYDMLDGENGWDEVKSSIEIMTPEAKALINASQRIAPKLNGSSRDKETVEIARANFEFNMKRANILVNSAQAYLKHAEKLAKYNVG